MPTAREVFAQAMRDHRHEQGLSQEALAHLAGIHRTYISSVERGERNIGLDNIEKIASALGVPVSQLFLGNTPEERTE